MHIIRLRAAWEPTAGGDAGAGRCGFERSFGKPTNLGSERVFLVISPAPRGSVLLNRVPLSQAPASAEAEFRHDITSSVNIRNSLTIESDSPTLDHEVRLEIVE